MESSGTPTPPPPPPPPSMGGEEPPQGSWQRPADYYDGAPQPGPKSGCPRWLLFGCGGLGCLGLLLIFGLGAWMMRGGGSKLTRFIVTQLERDAEKLFAEEVPAEDRRRLRDELARLRENIDADRVDLIALQPVLSEINAAIRDRTLTPEEVADLIRALERINDAAASRPISVRGAPAPAGTPPRDAVLQLAA